MAAAVTVGAAADIDMLRRAIRSILLSVVLVATTGCASKGVTTPQFAAPMTGGGGNDGNGGGSGM